MLVPVYPPMKPNHLLLDNELPHLPGHRQPRVSDGAALAEIGDVGDAPAVVRRACGLWHLAWGLHLRLGPGLDWRLRRPDPDSAAAEQEAYAIRDSALRAIAFLARV